MVRVAVRTADAAFFSGEFVTAKHYTNDGRMSHFLTSSASASGIGIMSPLPESSDQGHLESYFNTINTRRARSLAVVLVGGFAATLAEALSGHDILTAVAVKGRANPNHEFRFRTCDQNYHNIRR
jgi:hypothetical protein